ncbi:MAG: hypothetical protein ACK4NP_14530 [Parvularculaceae bacterium]
MKPIGAPDIVTAQRLASSAKLLRQQSEVARKELVTGRIENLPQALGKGLGQALILRGALDAIEGRREALSQARLLAGVAQRALSSAADGARAIASDAIAASGRHDEAALAAAANEARIRLQAAFSSLNVRVAGQSAFAGDGGDRPALASADRLLADVRSLFEAAADADAFNASLSSYFNDPAGGFNSAIYIGGAGDAPSIEIGKGERLAFTLRANDPALRDLLRSMATIAVAASAPPSALRDGALDGAASSALAGVDGVIARQAEIGIAAARAAEVEATLEIEESALTEAYNAQTARDPFEAASRLQSLENQLEAALTLAARISRLTLANFIR